MGELFFWVARWDGKTTGERVLVREGRDFCGLQRDFFRNLGKKTVGGA